jgi:hypothetical protein
MSFSIRNPMFLRRRCGKRKIVKSRIMIYKISAVTLISLQDKDELVSILQQGSSLSAHNVMGFMTGTRKCEHPSPPRDWSPRDWVSSGNRPIF